MTEEASVQPTVDPNASITRQRKKRKWDQPAEAVVSAAASIPGLLPFGGPGALAGIGLPGIFPAFVGVFPTITTTTAASQISPVSTVQQNAAAIVQKINQDLATKGLVAQTKIQDELIAREIVINDAEPGVRYKLTKRQTQEEIQLKTGAVVITRGKYKPPNGPVGHEKPLYLHISAGVHLKDTAERIRAVDQAAALVDEMLKLGRHQVPSSTAQLSSGAATSTSPSSTVVFVDFEADSPVNLINRIRGPNDQYINHIMNETGATVILKGGSCESSCSEEIPQPLHLFISADHPKSLDDARSLAENLLDTIRSEFIGQRPPYFQPAVSYNLQQPLPPYQVSPPAGSSLEPGKVLSYSLAQQPSVLMPGNITITPPQVTRAVSSKVYSAVPPPKELLTAVESTGNSESVSASVQLAEGKPDLTSLSNAESTSTLSLTLLTSSPVAALASASSALTAYAGYPGSSMPYPAAAGQSYGIYPQASQGNQPYSSYSAYSGLYPQASPLQQVALALQRPPQQVSIKPTCLAPESAPSTKSQNNASQGQAEKQEKQRRKFREFPVPGKEPWTDQPLLTTLDERLPSVELARVKQQTMPPPKALPPRAPSNMSPPPPKSKAPMGPPPPKAMPSAAIIARAVSNIVSNSMVPSPPVSVKMASASSKKEGIEGIRLVEYGEDEDDAGIPEDDRKDATPYANGKPFWAA